ncbi:MAG: ChbG/HpnK family deacetylase [Oscillospiraceae bacterium]|nr:ChbG/HpnK family deacetylase [Oscillospiraceae bacterium]
MKKVKIIMNADDFGFSNGINRGIIEAYKKGLISSTTIMVNMPYFEEAVELSKQNEGLGIGLHIDFTYGEPITINHSKSIIDEDGNCHSPRKLRSNEIILDYDEVYNEISAQLEKLKSYDVKITHLDCHHFIDHNDVIRKAMYDLAKKNDLPIRVDVEHAREEALKCGLKSTSLFCRKFYGDDAKAETIIDYVRQNNEVESIEIMNHVGYIDEDTRSRTTYIDREDEIKELERLKEMGFYDEIELITFSDLLK